MKGDTNARTNAHQPNIIIATAYGDRLLYIWQCSRMAIGISSGRNFMPGLQ